MKFSASAETDFGPQRYLSDNAAAVLGYGVVLAALGATEVIYHDGDRSYSETDFRAAYPD